MRKTWSSRFKQSVQFRLTCFFILILLPLVAVSTFSNLRSQSILKEGIGERTQNAMFSVMNSIDLTMQGVYELATVLANDHDANRKFENAGDVLTPGAILDFQTLNKQIATVSSVNRIIPQVSLFHYPSGMLLSTTGYQKEENKEELEWVQQAIGANGRITIFFPRESRYNANRVIDPVYNENNLVVMRLMNLQDPQRRKNIVLLPLSKSYFAHLLEGLLPGGNAQAYLLTEKGELAASTAGAAAAAPPWPDDARDLLVRELPGYSDPMLMVRAVSPASGWTLIMLQPEKEILKETRQLQVWTSLIIAVSVLISLWISWVVYSSISKPMRKMISAMKQMRIGQLDTQIVHSREDEFGYVMDTFNHMAREQRHLIEDVYEKQLLLVQTEFRLLQSQINPHFLYNTLDSIYSAALLRQEEELGDMVLHLSKFLRYSLGKGRETYSVAETFRHLDHYIKVQQGRFDFKVSFQMEEEAGEVKLLKLLLQPLVENAILHGLEKKQGERELTISAGTAADRSLILEVKDSGTGIPEERLAYIRQELAAITTAHIRLMAGGADASPELFGLRNVLSRIKLHYGEEAELRVDSVENIGTCVTLRLPPRQERGPAGDAAEERKEGPMP
ncbi:sensor histidine kinase [Paenibacillus mucilaginosus]|uniref:Integral membrane sensor signal transduction histidine kinase n=2 Tax=Paenibacillus mucilaginosus TaxID=61624 RepID=H6NP07_9BACL|nr:histidine kinase [Paenibacillus mucilaginosus]AEI43435.1 integral membrane sensor signal transduction histidine kinase [Paenibacillus mucilaginosus KNP414]AFC31081.1 integral membrane sensor signal transduction histidine kinase [Paenibacillus mucilaginosus 3016]MCG7212019.1 sensor histidine kinase [Paenibacillus mucilaginosus]WDM24994.1 sensor histidine kinase [Paenibacillus mucilaginosus]WFA19665.1 sensor histidine kinase [Paenibacillus mucilaginosus]